MPQLFSHIKIGSTKRTTIDLSHRQVTTSDFGYLIPICMREMVPNDDFVVTPNVFARLAPLAVPTYGKVECRVHHFFVPNRILYPHWDAWITQDPSNNTIPPYTEARDIRGVLDFDPQINLDYTGDNQRGLYCKVMSNFGLNPAIFGVSETVSLHDQERINMFPFLAYYRIWLDYFADSSLFDHPALVRDFNSIIENGGHLAYNSNLKKLLQLRFCCYKKDYYTTAKVNPQDGDPALVGVDIASSEMNPGFPSPSAGTGIYYSHISGGSPNVRAGSSTIAGSNSKIGQFTVEAMRAASSLQRYKERNNYVGSKLINRLLAHFGISPEPERLDMAEFIGGSSFPIEIADVTSTSPNYQYSSNMQTKGLGEMAGRGIIPSAKYPDSVRYHAKEHGLFISLMSIVPTVGYYQGVNRLWFRGVTGDALDYYTPEFENLGYQPILNKEVFVPDYIDESEYTDYDSDGIFGYTPQYSEYKYQTDVLGGDFISRVTREEGNTGAINDSWHLFRKFYYDNENPLALNSNFVELDNYNEGFDRIFQVSDPSYDHFYFNISVDVKATRPMTGFTEPSLDATNEGDGRDITLPYGGTRL